MRYLPIVSLVLWLAAPLATAETHSHTTHITTRSDDGYEFQYIRNSDGDTFASLRIDGVRYITRDPGVLAELEKAMEKQREISMDHSRLGRRHSDLGREHAELGREHARLGREHARLARERSSGGDAEDIERQQRALEAEQRKLEDKQRALEDRQRDLEDEQRALEEKQRAAESDANREIEKIFQRAVREGTARRD